MSKSYWLELQTPLMMPKNLPEVYCSPEEVCCSPDQEQVYCRAMIGEVTDEPVGEFKKLSAEGSSRRLQEKSRIILKEYMEYTTN